MQINLFWLQSQGSGWTEGGAAWAITKEITGHPSYRRGTEENKQAFVFGNFAITPVLFYIRSQTSEHKS